METEITQVMCRTCGGTGDVSSGGYTAVCPDCNGACWKTIIVHKKKGR